MNQQGVTFLEIVVVIAILMITSALVAPSIQDWRQKRALESDFQAVLAKIDYLKIRARTLNGSARLSCSNAGGGSVLTYKVSDNSDLIVEDPSTRAEGYNLLSGKTLIISTICNNSPAIFSSDGRVAGGLDIILKPLSGSAATLGYRLVISPTTAFVQKYKCNDSLTCDNPLEID